jgi:hypothetical protein
MREDENGSDQKPNGFAQEVFWPGKKSGGKPAFPTSRFLGLAVALR